MTTQNKRDRLIDAAATLFHRKGLSLTSLADIAKQADIPIGNVYYYFKTKEELALAAIKKHREQFVNAYALLDEGFADPRQRLIEATNYFDKVREEYTRYGCPVAKIIEDADMEKDAAAKEAAMVYQDFVEWAERQFLQLGQHEQARGYAVSLLAGIQGGALMAKAFRNPKLMSDEVARLVSWLESIPNKKIHIGKASIKSDAA